MTFFPLFSLHASFRLPEGNQDHPNSAPTAPVRGGSRGAQPVAQLGTPCRAMPCHAMLSRAMPFCAMPSRAMPCRAVPCLPPRPPAPLPSQQRGSRWGASAQHPTLSERHVLKQAGYQPHDKSIGLFCNVIYIKASGAAGLKRSKMFSESLSCLCLGGAINSTGRTN